MRTGRAADDVVACSPRSSPSRGSPRSSRPSACGCPTPPGAPWRPGPHAQDVERLALDVQRAHEDLAGRPKSAHAVAVATPCWPAPVSAMMRFLPIRCASSTWPMVLLILCAPVWRRSSRLSHTWAPPKASVRRAASVSGVGRPTKSRRSGATSARKAGSARASAVGARRARAAPGRASRGRSGRRTRRTDLAAAPGCSSLLRRAHGGHEGLHQGPILDARTRLHARGHVDAGGLRFAGPPRPRSPGSALRRARRADRSVRRRARATSRRSGPPRRNPPPSRRAAPPRPAARPTRAARTRCGGPARAVRLRPRTRPGPRRRVAAPRPGQPRRRRRRPRAGGAWTNTPTRSTPGGRERAISDACASVTWRLLPGQKLNPTASTPASMQASASSRRVMPQTLMRVLTAAPPPARAPRPLGPGRA